MDRFFFFFLAMQFVCSQLPTQPGIEPGPRPWKPGALAIMAPENSPVSLSYKEKYIY